MRFRINGISTPWGGVSWEIKESDKNNAISLIDFLSGQRILRNSCEEGCKNCSEYSPKSVSKIKDLINQQIMKITEKSEYKIGLIEMREICNNFLNNSDCQKLLHSMLGFSNKKSCPVLKYRKDIAEIIINIITTFKLEIDSYMFFVLESNGYGEYFVPIKNERN
jgi:hypothetical protein